MAEAGPHASPDFDAAAILEGLPDAFLTLDRGWRFTYVNAAAEQLLGRPRAELLGADYWALCPQLLGTPLEQHFRRAMAERVSITFEQARLDRQVQYRLAPLPNGGLAVALHDDTERHRAEATLRLSQERLRLAAEVAGLGLWDYDAGTDTLYWDRRTKALLGMPPDGVVEGLKTYLAAVHPDDRDDALRHYRQAMAESYEIDTGYECRVIGLSDGVERWIQSSGKAFYGPEPGAVRVIGTVLDITGRKRAEQALRESEERLRLATSAIGLGTWDHDLLTDRRAWSAETKAIFGVPEEAEPDDALLVRAIHPEDYPQFRYRYLRARDPAHRGAFKSEFRLRRLNDGAVRWVALRGRFLFNEQGRAVRAIGIIIDVTEEKRSAEALRTSERRLSDALEAVGDAFYAVDGALRFTEVSRRALELWGKSRDELLGRPITEVWPDMPEGETLRALTDTIASGRPVKIEARSATLPGRWIAFDVYPTAEGGAAAAFRDITDRRRAEEALRDSEHRLRMAVEAADIGTWDFHPREGTVAWSDRTKAIFGLAPDAVVDYARFLSLVHPEDRERADRHVRAALDPAGRGEVDHEYRVITPDGTVRWLASRGRAVFEDGVTVRCVGTLLDITERKAAEADRARFAEVLEERVAERTRALAAANAQLTTEIAERQKAEKALLQVQRLEAIGHLTGGVAHDFNNLLTVIAGNLDMIEAALPRVERIRPLIAAAQKGAERGARLTSQLLAFARRQTLRPEVVDLNELLHDFHPLIAHAVGEEIAIEYRCDPALWRSRLDPTQFQSAILNLAVNARDAMPRRGRLVIETSNIELAPDQAPPETLPGPYVMVVVTDTGRGIPQGIIDRIFEPFFTTKEVGRGTGLGLSQVYGFVRQSGGAVTVESRAGIGSSFRLYLPRAERPPADPLQPAIPAASAGSGTVLVVEDDRDVLEIVLATLASLGYRTVTARSGPEAIDALYRGDHVDLLFTDIVMPHGMNGIELAREARRLRPGLKVLFTSGYAAQGQAGYPGLEPGVVLLTKPYRQAELAAKVQAALKAPA